MMKYLILLGFCVIITNTSNAQTTFIEIEYSFKVTHPEGGSSVFFNILKDNGRASIYTYKDTPIIASGMIMPLDKSKSRGIYIDKLKNRSYQYEPIFKKDFYISEDSLSDKFIWTIHDTVQKTILGYSCKLATCKFRGREYNAFFSELLPSNTGPWKLSGLPGTILEAKTQDGMYEFTAYKITITSRPENISNPYDIQQIQFLSFVEHKKLFLKKISDYQKKVQSEEKDNDVTYSFQDNSIELLKEQSP